MKKSIVSGVLAAAMALVLSGCCNNAQPEQISGYTDKEAIQNILDRKSVRVYTDQTVEQEKVELMLKAAMAAPTGSDRRPWEFVVLCEKESIAALAEALPKVRMLQSAPLAIVVCGNQATSPNWYLDCSAATQNLLLAAEALGLGAVWTGGFPYEDRMEAIKSVIDMPEEVLPLAVIPIGYPGGDEQPKDKFDASRIHYNKW